MPNYIKFEPLRQDILNDVEYDCDTVNHFLEIVDSQPFEDVESVVRCKDCEYSGKTSDDEEDYYCQNKHGLNGYICDVSYCCNGKRKEGTEE